MAPVKGSPSDVLAGTGFFADQIGADGGQDARTELDRLRELRPVAGRQLDDLELLHARELDADTVHSTLNVLLKFEDDIDMANAGLRELLPRRTA